MDLLCFFLSCVCYVFVRVCLYVLCGHLLGKGLPLDSNLVGNPNRKKMHIFGFVGIFEYIC